MIPLLDLDSYAKWAGEKGGHLRRNDDGSPDVRAALDEASIEQDQAILKNFAGHVVRQSVERKTDLDPSNSEHLVSLINTWPTSLAASKDLKPSTVERYLVTMRRYARFRGLPDNQFKGLAPFNRRRRGPERLISESELKAWLEQVSSENHVVNLASWLLIARVPVGRLTTLRFDENLVSERHTRVIKLSNARKLTVPGELSRLLSAQRRKVAPDGFFLTVPGQPDVPVAPTMLRKLWEVCRGTGSDQGPLMRDVSVFSRTFDVDLIEGQLHVKARLAGRV